MKTITLTELKERNEKTLKEKKAALKPLGGFFPAYGYRIARVEGSMIKLAENLIKKGFNVCHWCGGNRIIQGLYVYNSDFTQNTSIHFVDVPYRYQTGGKDVSFDSDTMHPEIKESELIAQFKPVKKLDASFIKNQTQIIL